MDVLLGGPTCCATAVTTTLGGPLEVLVMLHTCMMQHKVWWSRAGSLHQILTSPIRIASDLGRTQDTMHGCDEHQSVING